MTVRSNAFLGAAAVLALAAGQAHAQWTGPSSTKTPYLTPVASGVLTQSLVTVADSVPGTIGGSYRMVGIPDGLGAFDNGDGTVTVVMNHELGATSGVARAHGATGAFVSEWRINKDTRQVIAGGDLITATTVYDKTTGLFGVVPTAIGRFCSADLAAPSAYYNAATGLGTQERIFMNGEEIGDEGRAWGTLATGAHKGASWELPSLGRFSWENSVARPYASDKTVVIGTDDTTPGQVYMYVGTKRSTGNEFEKAGLMGGVMYGVRANGLAAEDRATGIGGSSVPFTMVSLGDVTNKTGGTLQAHSMTAGVTQFLRPEDGAWDPEGRVFYFVTTDRFDQVKSGEGTTVGRSRLWRLTFSDAEQPELGGTIDMLLDGTEATQMMDQIAVDHHGNILIQEDVGNQRHSGKIWNYNIATDTLTMLAMHDVARFGELGIQGPTAPFSQDEEASGIMDASDLLGPGWFLFDDQAHYGLDTELVEGGQLLALYNPLSNPCAADLNGDGIVDFADYTEFLNLFDAVDFRVDFTSDGRVDFSDYLQFLNFFDAGC